jgi:hypothetical protein
MTQLLAACIPFAGFYGSAHDAQLDYAAQSMFSDDQGDANRGLVERLTYSCSWHDVQKSYAARFVEEYCEAVGFEACFESMQSPKFYNFETDRIFVTLAATEARRMFENISPGTMTEKAEERHTSRSGFISFYTSDWRQWGEVETWDHNQLQTMIEAYAADMADEVDEVHLMEDAWCNGNIESWIENNTPGIERLYRVHEYLRTRDAHA